MNEWKKNETKQMNECRNKWINKKKSQTIYIWCYKSLVAHKK